MKKRILSLTLCVVMLLSSVPFFSLQDLIPDIKASAEESASTIYFGDVNENGRVEASDARQILLQAASLTTLTERQLKIADMNQDGKITATDARTALRTAAKLETPVEFVSGETVSKGDYITALMNEVGLSGTDTEEQFFANVTSDLPCYDAVQAAVEWDILSAEEDFDPDEKATIEFAVKAAESAIAHDNITEEITFVDKNTDLEAECPVELAESIIAKAKDYRLGATKREAFDNIVINENVVNFDASEITAVAEDEFTFNSFGDETPESGDIFIADSEYGQTAEKIESVTDNGDGTYTVTTVQPDMDEVFDDFDFVDYATPDSDEFTFTPAAGVYTAEESQPYARFADSRSKDEKDVFGINLVLNSVDNPDVLPDMCCKISSDYIDALNMTAENKNVPNSKKILEDYNQQLKVLTGDDGEKTVVATPVKKYESGWSLTVDISLSDFEIDFDFNDFWETGNYKIGFSAYVTQNIDFEGNFSAKKHLGTLHFTHGIKSLFFKVDIEVYAYIDINGKIIITGDGTINQTYGNFDGKTDTLSNNTFAPYFNANINAEAGFDFCPSVSTLGFELAAVSINIGANASASLNIVPLVEYKSEFYYYPDNPLDPPAELELNILACLNLDVSFPIIRVTVSAGEDIKKQVEKWKKKGKDIPDIPLEKTFKICTLDKDSLLTPVTLTLHTELLEEAGKVDKCTKDTYNKLAHMYSGYVVTKNDQKVLPDAKVELIDKDNNVVSTAVTDVNGEFDLKFIPYGEYSIKITSDGTSMTVDKKITVDKNEMNIGKLEFEEDPLKIYVEFLQKQGKKVSSNAEYENTTGKTRNYQFSDAAMCELDNTNKQPELVVCYSGTNSYTLFRIYGISNGKVIMLKEFVDITGVYTRGFVSIWKDPVQNSFVTLYERVSAASMHSEYYADIVFPFNKNIITYERAYNYVSSSMTVNKETYDSAYRKYLKGSDGPINISKYTVYELKNEAYSKIRIAVIDADGTCSIKTYNF